MQNPRDFFNKTAQLFAFVFVFVFVFVPVRRQLHPSRFQTCPANNPTIKTSKLQDATLGKRGAFALNGTLKREGKKCTSRYQAIGPAQRHPCSDTLLPLNTELFQQTHSANPQRELFPKRTGTDRSARNNREAFGLAWPKWPHPP